MKLQEQFGLARAIIKIISIWAQWRPFKVAKLLKQYSLFLRSGKIRAALYENGLTVPPMIILSATMKCNLDCVGCYSRDYPVTDELSLEEIDNLFCEAEELGVGYFIITGGEPFIRKGLLELLVNHHKLIFLVYNNGTFIDKKTAEIIGKAFNIVAILSVEGGENETDARRGPGVYKQVMKAMALLRQADARFGFSAMITKKNRLLTQEEHFYDDLINRGCKVGFCIGYVPIGCSADNELLLSEEEQKVFRNKIVEMQRTKRLLLVHMPDDEYRNGTCMAAGNGFIHINAQGFVEPCPFAHVATHSIREHSLKECLDTDLLKEIRNRPDILEKPVQGCALVENRDELNRIAEQVGAVSTELKRNEKNR